MSIPADSSSSPLDQRFRGRLRNNFLLVLLPISMMLIAIMGGAAYMRARTLLEEQVNAQLSFNLQSLAVQIDKWLTTKTTRLDLAIRSETFQEAMDEALAIDDPVDPAFLPLRETVLDELRTTTQKGGNLLFNHFLVLTPEGEILIASRSDWEGVSLANKEYYNAISSDAMSIAVYAPDPLYSDQITILTSIPYYYSNNTLRATIVGISSSISIQNILQDVTRFHPDAKSYIITTRDEFIGLETYKNELTLLQPSTQQANLLLPLKDSYTYNVPGQQYKVLSLLTFEETPVVAIYTWVPSLDIGLVIELPQEIAFGPLNALAPFTIIMTGFMGILLGILTWIATQRLVQPLTDLTYATEQFALGNWDLRAPVGRSDEIGRLAYTFNHMADDLSQLYISLESQVVERTSALERRSKQLEATAQVAREAAAIHSLDELLTYATQLISEHFGFYHTGIFLLDNTLKYAVLQAANSEGGQQMLTRAHKLEVGQSSVIGYVADTGLPRVALDVGADAYFFKSPDLPMTRSEMALPLKFRDKVIGVLDVQSTETAAFAEPDVEVLQILADQVALAIENARLLDQSQDVIQELQIVHSEQMIRGWHQQLGDQPKAYHFDLIRVVPATQAQIEVHGSFVNNQPLANTTEAGHILTLPIALRGQTLGSITLRRDLNENPWSPDDLDLAHDTVAQIAVALDNARLLDEAQRRAEHEQTVSTVSARLSRSMDIDSILKAAVHELGQLPGVADASVHIGPSKKSSD